MRRTGVATSVLALAIALIGPAVVHPATASAAQIIGVREMTPHRTAITVASPAMGRNVDLQVLHPASGGSRGTYYLLDGLDPGTSQSTWTNATDAEDFFRGKNVNVVLPIGGQASYYTDWITDDPRFGRYKWETFLTRELPGLIDGHFDGNGLNGIGGLSMGGNAAYIMAARHPGLYRAVAGYSACPDSAMAAGAIMFSIANRGGNPGNMWGAPGSPEWAAHDPALMIEGLRGKALYMSTGTGIPGPHEAELEPMLAENIFLGGPIELAVNTCMVAFDQRLRGAGIGARIDYHPVGTHSWSYWQDALHASWPVIGPALGA